MQTSNEEKNDEWHEEENISETHGAQSTSQNEILTTFRRIIVAPIS